MAKKPARRPAPQRQTRTRTRQNKGTLVSDPAANTKLLSEQLSALGLYAAPTLGDGNCLFRALSDQIYGSPSKHLLLRDEICDWIEAHRQRYEPFVDDERGLDVHLQCMRQPGTYGGHLELSAFAHLKRRDVKVIQPGLVYVIEWSAGGDPSSPVSPRSPIMPNSPLSDRDTRRMKRGLKKELKEKEAKRHEDDDESEEELKHSGTVYVAYHDWEHFSSVRNLTGPHAGLPNVVEKPAPPTGEYPDGSTPYTKPRSSKSSKKTRNAVLRQEEPVDSDVNSTASPSAVPLPMSRPASPSPPSEVSASASSTSLPIPPIPGYSSIAMAVDSPPPSIPKLYLRINRSPKRSIDESSGTSTQSSNVSSQGQAKRVRGHSRELSDTHVDVDGDTPGFTASDSSSSSSASSPAPSTPPATVIAPSKPTMRLTRRQRKAQGLPHPRSQLMAKLNTKKIVVSQSKKGGSIAVAGGNDGGESVEGEWTKNGSGRLDVRGFKELKI